MWRKVYIDVQTLAAKGLVAWNRSRSRPAHMVPTYFGMAFSRFSFPQHDIRDRVLRGSGPRFPCDSLCDSVPRDHLEV